MSKKNNNSINDYVLRNDPKRLLHNRKNHQYFNEYFIDREVFELSGYTEYRKFLPKVLETIDKISAAETLYNAMSLQKGGNSPFYTLLINTDVEGNSETLINTDVKKKNEIIVLNKHFIKIVRYLKQGAVYKMVTHYEMSIKGFSQLIQCCDQSKPEIKALGAYAYMVEEKYLAHIISQIPYREKKTKEQKRKEALNPVKIRKTICTTNKGLSSNFSEVAYRIIEYKKITDGVLKQLYVKRTNQFFFTLIYVNFYGMTRRELCILKGLNPDKDNYLDYMGEREALKMEEIRIEILEALADVPITLMETEGVEKVIEICRRHRSAYPANNPPEKRWPRRETPITQNDVEFTIDDFDFNEFSFNEDSNQANG